MPLLVLAAQGCVLLALVVLVATAPHDEARKRRFHPHDAAA